MAKAKAKSKVASVSNKPLYSRVSYLYQAAAYLAAQSESTLGTNSTSIQSTVSPAEKPVDPSLSSSRHLLSDLRAVSLKSQIRLSPAIKHTMCRRCHTPLLDESTCSTEIENKSKGGKKHWADVLVRTCKNCGFQRRIPAGAERQKRRPYRSSNTQVLPIQGIGEKVS